MNLDTTTKSLEVKLGAAHTTRALQFFTSYGIVDVTLNTITSTKTFGSTNGTTAVTILPAPASNKLNQLKFCSIYNCDSIDHTVTIQLNSSSSLRTIYSMIVKVGEQIQFTLGEGWKIFNMDGILKTSNSTIGTSSVKANTRANASSAASSSSVNSGTDYAYYLGKADRNYNTVTISLNVGVAISATVSWAEAAIYKGYPIIGSNCTLTRCGYVDISTGTNHGVNATGGKTIVIPITDNNLFIGDDIWFVIGCVTTGAGPTITTIAVADNIGSGIVQSATGSQRPSTTASIAFTASSALNPLFIAWQGTQDV
jgi:hypothetical protein